MKRRIAFVTSVVFLSIMLACAGTGGSMGSPGGSSRYKKPDGTNKTVTIVAPKQMAPDSGGLDTVDSAGSSPESGGGESADGSGGGADSGGGSGDGGGGSGDGGGSGGGDGGGGGGSGDGGGGGGD